MDKELLKKYLTHTCNETELQQVTQFLKQPESEQLLNDVLDEAWLEMEESKPDQKTLNRYRKQFIEIHRPAEKATLFLRLNWLKYAAIVMLVCSAGIYALLLPSEKRTTKIVMMECYNPKGQRSTITLSDSTVIFLGSNSKIRYPKTFSNTRDVQLEGEAFFEVKRDPLHPFIIHTGKVQTKVLGTSFKVAAFAKTPIEVSVATGKVRVDTQEESTNKQLNPVAILTPGQTVKWNEKTKKAVLGKVSIEDIQHWKDGNLTFSDQRLEEVVAVLARSYNVDIDIKSEQLANYRINTTCSLNEPINNIMSIICRTGDFKYKLTGRHIIIYY